MLQIQAMAQGVVVEEYDKKTQKNKRLQLDCGVRYVPVTVHSTDGRRKALAIEAGLLIQVVDGKLEATVVLV